MRRILTCLVLSLGVFFLIPPSGSAQTAASLPTVDQIIDRAAQASGGKAAWANVTSMRIRGSLEIPASHMSGTFEIYSKAPNRAYQVFSFGEAGAMKQGFDGVSAWKTTPDHGVVDILGDELETTKIDSDFYSEIDLKQLYPQMVLQGESTVGGHPAYTILATPLHGKTRKLYFDKATGLHVGMTSQTTENGKISDIDSYYEDFKTVEGIQVPYTIRMVTPDATIVLHVRDLQTNLPMMNSTFLKPAGKMNPASPSSGATSSAASQTETPGVSGNTFTSHTFGFTYDFPAGWTVASEETNKEVMKMGRDMVAGNNPMNKAAVDASLERTSRLLMVSEYPIGTPGKPNSSIQIMAERVDFAPGIKTGEDYLLNTAVGLKNALPAKISDNITQMTIGGKQFYRMNVELHLPAATVTQAYISTKLEKHALSFIISTRSPEELETLVGSLNSVQFISGSR